MTPTDAQLEAALRAASAEIPDGAALIMVIVATEGSDDTKVLVSDASNIKTARERVHLLRLTMQKHAIIGGRW